jgi:hypothetical protein
MPRLVVEASMRKILDVVGVAAVAIVFLLPKASVRATQALVGEKVELDAVAELEDAHYADPASVDKAVALAEAYLRLLHPDWALSTTAAYADKNDPRVFLVRSTAFAERLEAQACVDEAQRGLKACDAAGDKCGAGYRTKLDYIASGMKALIDKGIDPRKDPKRAREAVAEVLHATKAKGLSPAPKK